MLWIKSACYVMRCSLTKSQIFELTAAQTASATTSSAHVLLCLAPKIAWSVTDNSSNVADLEPPSDYITTSKNKADSMHHFYEIVHSQRRV
ncbi:unnamed protein product [Nippostrongylus brasiliensis]|uniref:Secreted protein n=1 Tax=Nippostrongylus brasiliensis TaxID=27835 RepID=A0A0N4XIT8_NIPBR|nr:unnamed protein product [Nippostrongylus brasiliensis]VDL66030.1 unnamed protein product [Nippostrongylus brasiliensis]